MKKFLWFCGFLCLALPATANNNLCQNAEVLKDAVKITYNYGELLFDASKTSQEISVLCQDNAAGCFQHKEKGGRWTVVDTNVKVGNDVCVVPYINVTYDFSGSQIFITNEYDPCRTRAVLRHELQHFMIWKTTKEWFLKDLKYSLQNVVKNHAVLCPENNLCSTRASWQVRKTINQVERRWHKLEEQNQNLLDSTDHSATAQVNYPVCAPYSLRVGLF